MGMMNNPWFRIKVHKMEGPQNEIWFEHPTMPGNESGGWMTEDSEIGRAHV